MIFWYFELIQKSAADAALLLQQQHYYCNCSTGTVAAANFPHINLSLIVICQIIQFAAFTSLTSITAAAAAAVAAPFWINDEYQTTSVYQVS